MVSKLPLLPLLPLLLLLLLLRERLHLVLAQSRDVAVAYGMGIFFECLLLLLPVSSRFWDQKSGCNCCSCRHPHV